MKTYKAYMVVLVGLLVLSGCIHCPLIDPKVNLIMYMDDHIIPLSKALDVMADEFPPDAKDDVIFQAILKRTENPKLLDAFKGYMLKARVEDGVGIILLCTQDGREGLIEDVSCTTRPDTHRPAGSPCEYFLDVKKVCDAP